MGRMQVPFVKAEERFCKNCNHTNSQEVTGLDAMVETEFHFLCTCKKHEKLRRELFNEGIQLNPNFDRMTLKNKFIWLLSCSSITRSLGGFIKKAMENRILDLKS